MCLTIYVPGNTLECIPFSHIQIDLLMLTSKTSKYFSTNVKKARWTTNYTHQISLKTFK